MKAQLQNQPGQQRMVSIPVDKKRPAPDHHKLPGIMRFLLTTIIINLFFVAASFGQITIVSDGLNNSSTHFTTGGAGGSYVTGNSASGDRPATSPFAVEGTHGRSTLNNTSTLTSTANINTTGYSNIQLSLRVAAFSVGSTSNGMDNGDVVEIAISTNSGSNYTTILTVEGNNNCYWAYSATGVATTAYPTVQTFTPANGGSRTADGYSTMTITSLPASSTLRVRITMTNSSASERWVVDDFKITGCQTSAAGADQANCNNGSFTLAGNTPTAGSGAWSVVGGTASVTTPSSPTSGVTGVPLGTSATLRWTITNGSCATTDDVILSNNNNPSTADAGTDQTNCNSGSFTMNAAAPTIGTGAWSVVGGTATVTTPSSRTSTVTGVPSGTTATLRWTVSNNPCTASIDDVTLTNVAASTVPNAGTDQSNCNSGNFTLAGNTITSGTGTWSVVSGTANITTPSLRNSTVTGVPVGTSATLRWTVTNAPCATLTDDVILTNADNPTTANAGTDGTSCVNAGNTLAANTATVGTGAWTIPSGPNTSTAQITGGLNNPAATFTPTASGTYTLRWTISNNPCTASFDDVVYTVNPLPQVSSFTGNAICSGGVGQLTITTSAGTGPFDIIYNPSAISESGVVSGSPFFPTPLPVSTSNYTLTSITDANGCTRTTGFTDNSATITLNTDGTWTGTAGTNWFDPANWCGGVPSASTDVIIPSGGNQPTINGAGAVCNNITINSGATLTLTGSNTLTVSGNWSNSGTFTANAGTTVDLDGGTQTVSGSSTTTFRNLTVNSSTSLSLNSNAAIAGVLSVPSSKLLIVNGTTLTINSGATGSVSGTIRNSGTITPTGTLTFNSTGSYEHNFTTSSGVVPASTWAAGSNCKITGYTSFTGNPSGGPNNNGGYDQAFADFTWNCPGQTGASAISFGGTMVTINGNFTITNTGSGSLSLGANGTGNLTVGGNFSQTGGSFFVSTAAARNMTVAGNFSLSGGTFNLSSSGTAANTVNVNVAGDFAHTAGTLTESGSVTTTAIVFNKAGTQLYTSGGTVSNSVDFTVNSGSTLQMGTGAAPSTITGSGTFVLSNGGTLAITSAAGITSSGATGNIQASTRTFNTGANYKYIGTATQVTGNGLPATVNNLTIDNTGGSTGVTLTGSVTVNGTLDFVNGLLTTGSNTVTIASAASITNASASKYVNGKLAKAFTNTTPFTYPIGKGGNYRPVIFNYAATTSKTVTIEQFEAAFPVAIPASVSVANFGNRYWNITQSATGTAFTVALNNSGVTPVGTVRMIRSEGGGASSSNATSFSSPNYSNSSTFATANVSSNVALGETAIPLTINGVTVTATKVYDGNTTAVLNSGSATLSGVISPDVVTLNSGSAVGNYNNKHVGTGKAVTVTGFTLGGANGGAYALPTPNQIAGLTADITERTITVTAVSTTKTYDGTTSSPGVPTYSLQAGDATGTAPTQTYDTKHVGTGKTLTASGLVINDGNSGNNYIISYADNNTGVIDVRNITVTAATDTKFFDGNTSSSAAPTYTLQAGDVTDTAPTQTFDNANVGTGKTLTASGLVINDGNSGNNYNISYATNNTGVINQLAVTVTPDAGQFKVIGDADPVFTYNASPSLVSPDAFTGALSRNSGESIGTYAYTLGTLSAGANYLLSLGGSNTFEIQPVNQSNADFRTTANGNFTNAAIWEYDPGDGNWTAASQAPTSVNNIEVLHNLTLNQDFTVGNSKNFVINNSGSMVVPFDRTFSVGVNGTANFNGKPVTFESANSGTASLGQVLGILNGATNVTVERYIPNNSFRSWRLLSVPTHGSGQTIRQAWQEGNANPLPMQNNVPGYGTQITGIFTTQAAAAAAGFDSTSVQASMLTWNGASWSNVTTTNTAIDNTKAYFLYVRGERSKGVAGAASNSSATILRTNGTVYTGDQVNNFGANSFALVPNLYPSSIDFTGLTRTGGVSNLFYIWDSKKQNGGSLGIYQTFSATNGFNCMISGGSYSLGQPNTIIESGQAFFVQTNNNPGTLTLKETSKTSSSNGHLGFRPTTPANALVKIDSRLFGTGANNMLDANVVVFDAAYSNDVDGDDAPKFTNAGENFGIQKTNVVLVIEGRQPAANNDVIQYKMWNMQQQSYTLELVAANMASQNVSAVLEDAYLNTSTPLDLTGTTSINFTVNSNAASAAANRFRIVFRQLTPVPVNFVSITGHRTNAGVKVDWKSASERGIKNYVVERSTDGRNFTAIGDIAPASNNAIEISYSFNDMAAPSTALMYRIRSQGINNETRYSPVAKVNALNVKPGFVISPNPVENGIVNLQFNLQQAGKYSVRMVSTEGKTLQVRSISHAGGSSVQTIALPETMARGTYTVEIIAPDNTKTVQTLFVNKN